MFVQFGFRKGRKTTGTDYTSTGVVQKGAYDVFHAQTDSVSDKATGVLHYSQVNSSQLDTPGTGLSYCDCCLNGLVSKKAKPVY